MSEDKTRQFHPFEDRVLGELQAIGSRLTALEEKMGAIDRETKPNWARLHRDFSEHSAEVRALLGNLDRKLDVINSEMLQLKSDQKAIEKRISKIEVEVRPQVIPQDRQF